MGSLRKPRVSRARHPSSTTNLKDLVKSLEGHIRSLPFDTPEGGVEIFVHFLRLLDKWNTVYNLTSVRDPGLMVTRHIMDSLVVSPFLQGQQVLDVGSGAGLPGIPLAIINPDTEFTLLDSNQKKTRFMQQAITELKLENVTVISQRIESFRPEQPFDTIIARAYSNMETLITGTQNLLAVDAVILAMKGTYPMAELENIPDGYRIWKIEKLDVPGLNAERHLVLIKELLIDS
ncbi:MAG TPA: 16S rRNA (guanine(527)-N(7))-methyltransferase RsmG [Gammaproteobacteria bacterium]|nr:16S rRNA (guanine(527)-N(7))-methyltransferase RsmG [Gammaproteobacteria bacterium]